MSKAIQKKDTVLVNESTALIPFELQTLKYRPDIKVSDIANSPILSTQQRSVILASLNEDKLKFINLETDV